MKKLPNPLPDTFPQLSWLADESGYLSFNPHDIAYLTGFSGSTGLVVVLDRPLLIVDSRYYEQAEDQAFPTVTVVRSQKGFYESLQEILPLSIQTLYFNSEHLSVGALQRLKAFFKQLRFKPAPKEAFLLRSQKSITELQYIRASQEITDQAFIHICNHIKLGMTERQLAWEVEKYMREHGAEEAAWHPFIVAIDENSSRPHHSPNDKQVKAGSLVQFDIGCRFKGYCSDLSRVLFVGTPRTEIADVYHRVQQSQEIALSSMRGGIKCSLVDTKVRTYLKDQPGAYQHALGHGIGLEVHERPVLHVRSKEILQPSMVVTVEPGIYVEDAFGIRLEDEVIITDNSVENITSAPKSLEEVIIT